MLPQKTFLDKIHISWEATTTLFLMEAGKMA
jgi:hypothetical protein